MSKRKVQAIHRMFKSNPGLVILQFNEGSIIHQKKQTPHLIEHYRLQTFKYIGKYIYTMALFF